MKIEEIHIHRKSDYDLPLEMTKVSGVGFFRNVLFSHKKTKWSNYLSLPQNLSRAFSIIIFFNANIPTDQYVLRENIQDIYEMINENAFLNIQTTLCIPSLFALLP